jgi:hypothetical protein
MRRIHLIAVIVLKVLRPLFSLFLLLHLLLIVASNASQTLVIICNFIKTVFPRLYGLFEIDALLKLHVHHVLLPLLSLLLGLQILFIVTAIFLNYKFVKIFLLLSDLVSLLIVEPNYFLILIIEVTLLF